MTKNTQLVEMQEKETANAIDLFANSMKQFRDEMENFDQVGSKIAARTRTIMRSVFAVLIINNPVEK